MNNIICNVLLGTLGSWCSCGCPLTCTTHLNIVTDHIHRTMATTSKYPRSQSHWPRPGDDPEQDADLPIHRTLTIWPDILVSDTAGHLYRCPRDRNNSLSHSFKSSLPWIKFDHTVGWLQNVWMLLFLKMPDCFSGMSPHFPDPRNIIGCVRN